jgi:hypothetical protein
MGEYVAPGGQISFSLGEGGASSRENTLHMASLRIRSENRPCNSHTSLQLKLKSNDL